MKTISITEARANLAATLGAVIDDAEPVIITRAGFENVVVLTQREYDSMREMMHLSRSPRNAARLDAAIAQLEAGAGRAHELVRL